MTRFQQTNHFQHHTHSVRHGLRIKLCFAIICLCSAASASAAAKLPNQQQTFFQCETPKKDQTKNPQQTAEHLPLQYQFRVVAKHPHRTSAFSQGLIYKDDILYESTGLKGQSSIGKFELFSGETLSEKRLDDAYFGEGIAIADDQIVQLTWRSGLAFRYDLATLEPIGQHKIYGEGWGLAYDGKHFISSDGSASLTWRDRTSLEPVKSLPVSYLGRPVKNLNELEWFNHCIFANIWGSTLIVAIEANSGKVSHSLDLKPLLDYERRHGKVDVANGIAIRQVNGESRLLVTGKHWQTIYEILPFLAP